MEGADFSSPLGALWPNAGQARQTGGRLACPAFLRGSCSLKPHTPEGQTSSRRSSTETGSSFLPSPLQAANLNRFQDLTLCFFFFFSPFSCRKMAVEFLAHERIWFEKFKYDEAERRYYEQMNGPVGGSSQQQQVKVCRAQLLAASRASTEQAEGDYPPGPAFLYDFRSGFCFFQGLRGSPSFLSAVLELLRFSWQGLRQI